MAMSEEEQAFLYALLSRVPGKTAQQKLNYIQDWASGLNIDLFGTPQEYVPSAAPIAYNETEMVYGQNPELRAIFNSIDQNVDPLTAVEQMGDTIKHNQYDPDTNPTGINYKAIAVQYLQDKLAAERAAAEWQASEQANYQKWSQDQPATMQDLYTTKYDYLQNIMGQQGIQDLNPSTLLEMYGRTKRPELYSTASKSTRLRSEHIDPNAPYSMFNTGDPKYDQMINDLVKKKIADRLEQMRGETILTETGKKLMQALPSLNFG